MGTKYFSFIGEVKIVPHDRGIDEAIDAAATALENGEWGYHYSGNEAKIEATSRFFNSLKDWGSYIGGKDSIRVDIVDFKGEHILVVDCSAGGWIEWAAIPEGEIEIVGGTFNPPGADVF